MRAVNVIAIWNVLLCLIILYSPSLICGVIFIAAISKKKKTISIITGILMIVFGVVSSIILYHIINFITSF